MKPRSIKILLSQGDPDGIRTAQMSMSTILAIAFKRIQLSEVRTQFKEIEDPGVYVLIGADSDQPQAYIGESESVGKRLATHATNSKEGRSKEYWVDTVVLISKDENLTKSHVRYVESKLLSAGRDNSRWSFPNDVSPSPNAGKLPIDAQAEMDEFVEQAKVLVGILGWDLFRDMRHSASNAETDVKTIDQILSSDKVVFKLKGKTHDAQMLVDKTGGHFVLKGSKARGDTAGSASEKLKLQRDELLKRNVMERKDEFLIFTSDYRFNSPSAAGSVVAGLGVNGRAIWKLDDGSSYDDWERKRNSQSPEK